jgi:spore maturation protein CgeB
MLEKIKFYLENEEKRAKIEDNMYARTIEEHTNEERFRKLFIDIQKAQPITIKERKNKGTKKFKQYILNYNWYCIKERVQINDIKIALNDLLYILNPFNY